MMNLDAYQDLLAPINQFLQCSTPDEWVEEAKKPENLQTILLDHLLCELKAGQSAMFLIRKYAVDKKQVHAPCSTGLNPTKISLTAKRGH